MYEVNEASDMGSLGAVVGIVGLVVCLLMLVSMWKLYTKAGRKGFISIIPIYNGWVLFEIAGLKGWFILLMCIPVVNVIMMFMLYFKLAKAFGKSNGFAIGMLFLPIIFIPLLAFGKNEYALGLNYNNPVETTSNPEPTQPVETTTDVTGQNTNPNEPKKSIFDDEYGQQHNNPQNTGFNQTQPMNYQNQNIDQNNNQNML